MPADRPDPVAAPTPKFMPMRTQAEDKVLRLARKYARMKLFSTYIEKNVTVTVCYADRDSLYAPHFLRELEDAAIGLLRAMSIDEVNGELQE